MSALVWQVFDGVFEGVQWFGAVLAVLLWLDVRALRRRITALEAGVIANMHVTVVMRDQDGNLVEIAPIAPPQAYPPGTEPPPLNTMKDKG